MTVFLVASAEPRAGRSLIAAGLAYRLARDGAAVTLARLAGGESAEPDAAAFASIDSLNAPAAPVTPDDVKSLPGDVILEAPSGSVKEISSVLGARVIDVGGATSAAIAVAGDALIGRLITRVPVAEADAVRARNGVLGVLVEDAILAVPSVEDIAATLGARWLHRPDEPVPVDRIMIGTVASDAGSPYFANRQRTCVITRFDKTDIQLAALLTDLRCMVITGGGDPSPYLLDRVRGRRDEVAVLAVDGSTVETMAAIEGLYGQSRFGGESKLERIVAMLDESDVQLPVAVAH
jgi:hypothetical protein